MKVKVVHGAPLSGKSTYVEMNKGSNDIIFDYDLVMSAISGLEVHNHNMNLVGYVLDIRDLIIARLKSEENIDTAWIIVTRVKEKLRQSLVGLDVEYIEIKTDVHTAKRRLYSNPGGRDIEIWGRIIEQYFTAEEDYSYFYKTKEWERKREVILRRDNYQCKQCSRYGKVAGANTVHHIITLQVRPDLKLNNKNLVSLCESCHEKMHNKFNFELSKLGEKWKERTLRKYPELGNQAPL